VWLKQMRLLGHAEGKLGGPAVILLGRVWRRDGRNVHPLLAPLSHGEAWSGGMSVNCKAPAQVMGRKAEDIPSKSSCSG
jgi:hypothetical protein